jgi:hypothetical protein
MEESGNNFWPCCDLITIIKETSVQVDISVQDISNKNTISVCTYVSITDFFYQTYQQENWYPELIVESVTV